jgi:hypothetical protein
MHMLAGNIQMLAPGTHTPVRRQLLLISDTFSVFSVAARPSS